MKYIYGNDTEEPNDFGVRVSDKVYKAIQLYLVQYYVKHSREVEFLKEWEIIEWLGSREKRRKNEE